MRSPFDLIVSAYRYHKSMNSTFGVRKISRNMCNDCGATDHKARFAMCDYACHYSCLLSKVDESTGVCIGAIDSRMSVEVMLANVKCWSDHTNVLHLPVEHLNKYFKRTVGCMFQFIGEPVCSQDMSILHDIAYQLNDVSTGAEHATRNKHNNENVRRFLVEHAHWGSQFRVITRISKPSTIASSSCIIALCRDSKRACRATLSTYYVK